MVDLGKQWVWQFIHIYYVPSLLSHEKDTPSFAPCLKIAFKLIIRIFTDFPFRCYCYQTGM